METLLLTAAAGSILWRAAKAILRLHRPRGAEPGRPSRNFPTLGKKP
jgi:hypothetical protein